MSSRNWFDNARSVSLVQSVMPSLLAVALAIGQDGFSWISAILAIVGVAFAHLAMNLSDDYFDYKVDMLGDRDKVVRQGFRAMMVKYPYLTDGTQTLKSTARVIALFVFISLSCGCGIVVERMISGSGFCGANGLWWILAIVALCAFLGVFYSAPPLKLAYRGLGEPVIGFIFGPLLMMGVYYSACGEMNWDVVLISIPVDLLVLNILFTHSFIDLKGDEMCNKMTLARLIGNQKANLFASAIFIFLPFVLIVAGVLSGIFNPLYLLVLLVLPRGIWLFYSLVEFSHSRMVHVERMPFWLGPILSWKGMREAGIDWFMSRWLGARNLLSGFCMLSILVSILVSVCLR